MLEARSSAWVVVVPVFLMAQFVLVGSLSDQEHPPPVPSLAGKDVQSYTDGQLKWVIDFGLWPSGMPGSKGILSDDEIWSIVLYLRHLPPARSLGQPQMYSQ